MCVCVCVLSTQPLSYTQNTIMIYGFSTAPQLSTVPGKVKHLTWSTVLLTVINLSHCRSDHFHVFAWNFAQNFPEHFNYGWSSSLKGAVQPKMTILWSFIHTHVFPNLHEWLSSVENKIRNIEECTFVPYKKLIVIQAVKLWLCVCTIPKSPDRVYVYPKGHMTHERVKQHERESNETCGVL